MFAARFLKEGLDGENQTHIPPISHLSQADTALSCRQTEKSRKKGKRYLFSWVRPCVSVSTLRRWEDTGRLETERTASGHLVQGAVAVALRSVAGRTAR